MKRGTIEHPKVEALAVALDTSLAAAVGHLEALIHFAAKYAPRGDIGKWPDEVIAKRSLWEKDAGEFCRAIVATRFADTHPTHRLVVHDWSEHADDAVHKMLERRSETFADGSPPYGRRGGKHVKTQDIPSMGTVPEPCRDNGATPTRQRHVGNVPARARASAPSDKKKNSPRPPLSPQNGTKPRKPRARSATTFPDGLVLTAEMAAYATGKGIAPERPPGMFERFETHHRAKGSVFVDWQAAWRTWVQKDVEFHPPPIANPADSWPGPYVWPCDNPACPTHAHESPNKASVPRGRRCPHLEAAHG